MNTINTTFKVEDQGVTYIGSWLEHHTDKLVSYKIVADTDNMYKNDPRFKELIKAKKKIQDQIYDYINENNHKHN